MNELKKEKTKMKMMLTLICFFEAKAKIEKMVEGLNLHQTENDKLVNYESEFEKIGDLIVGVHI